MESEIFKKGIAKRRKVLGDAYVDKALASADEMGADMQKLVTEYAWGEVWNKENLSDNFKFIHFPINIPKGSIGNKIKLKNKVS